MRRLTAPTIALIFLVALFTHFGKIIPVSKSNPILVLRKCVKFVVSTNAHRRVITNLEIPTWINHAKALRSRAKIAYLNVLVFFRMPNSTQGQFRTNMTVLVSF